jgi:hypothetical protein
MMKDQPTPSSQPSPLNPEFLVCLAGVGQISGQIMAPPEF